MGILANTLLKMGVAAIVGRGAFRRLAAGTLALVALVVAGLLAFG